MSILRMPAVKAETGHRSHASIYNAIRAGLFTKPVPIGERAVGWPSHEVQAINAARIAGKSGDEIKELVSRLHIKRAELAMDLDADHGHEHAPRKADMASSAQVPMQVA
jgi:prophage regulatory protein